MSGSESVPVHDAARVHVPHGGHELRGQRARAALGQAARRAARAQHVRAQVAAARRLHHHVQPRPVLHTSITITSTARHCPLLDYGFLYKRGLFTIGNLFVA